MRSYNYDIDKHYIMFIVNEMKKFFGLPKTEYLTTSKKIYLSQTYKLFDIDEDVEYIEYVKRYFYFWDFFGLCCNLKNLGIYNGVLYSFGEFELKNQWNDCCISKINDAKVFNKKYLSYRNEMIKLIETKQNKKIYRINIVSLISLLIKKYNKDKVFYITYMNNRMIDLFKLI